MLIQCFVIGHISYRLAVTENKQDDIPVMKWIWKVSFWLFIGYGVSVLVNFGWRKHLKIFGCEQFWNGIYKQSQLIQKQFKEYLNISLWKDAWKVMNGIFNIFRCYVC